MKSLEEQAAEIAVGVGTAFCREQDIPLHERDDCVQAGVVAALAALPQWRRSAKLSTFLYPRIRGTIRDYRAESANRGMGSKHARVAIVSLHDEVPHAHDFDGDPLRYEDILAYEEPPGGYADPLVENVRAAEPPIKDVLLAALQPLTTTERSAIVAAYGLGKQEPRTQHQIARRKGVTQAAVGGAIRRGILKMQKTARCISEKSGANKGTYGDKD